MLTVIPGWSAVSAASSSGAVFGGPAEARIRHFDYTRSELSYGRDLATLVPLLADGRLHPEIDEVRDWSRTGEVIADLRGRRIRGNAVLTVGAA